MLSEKQIKEHAIEMIGCDDAEINYIGDTYFLLTHYKKRSEGEWIKSTDQNPYEPVSFDYVERQVIASGKTLNNLMDDLRFYIKLLKAPRLDALLLVLEKHGLDKKELKYVKNTLEEIKLQH